MEAATISKSENEYLKKVEKTKDKLAESIKRGLDSAAKGKIRER